MTDIQTKIFYFIGGADSPVINVGMRPAAIHHGSGVHGLKIVAHNIPAANPEDVDRVEIIVRGEEKQILSFYNHAKSVDIRRRRLIKDGARPEVSELSVYDGEEPDWTYCIISTTHEQFYTGFDVLEKLGEDVGSIIKMIAVNREEDLKREEKNRREDRELMEKNRREGRELMEKNRREDRELMEKNRREDRELMEKNRREDIKRVEKHMELMERRIELMERNRGEDIKRAERNTEATNKLFDKLITGQNEILLDLKTIKKAQRN